MNTGVGSVSIQQIIITFVILFYYFSKYSKLRRPWYLISLYSCVLYLVGGRVGGHGYNLLQLYVVSRIHLVGIF